MSYLTRAPDGKWVHTTLWDVPAHTRVNVTVLQYDTGSPLRNQFFGLVSGTDRWANYAQRRSVSLINSNAGNGVGHTFTIPNLGINVPLVRRRLQRQEHLRRGAMHPQLRSTMSSSSPSSPLGRASTRGSASSRAGWVTCTARAARCRSIGYMDGFLKVVGMTLPAGGAATDGRDRRRRARRPAAARPTASAGAAPFPWWMIGIWAVLSVAADLIFWFVGGPHIPPAP